MQSAAISHLLVAIKVIWRVKHFLPRSCPFQSHTLNSEKLSRADEHCFGRNRPGETYITYPADEIVYLENSSELAASNNPV
jgi:hypothetical protein